MDVRRLVVLYLQYTAFTNSEVERSSYYDVKKNTFFSNPPLDIISAISRLDCALACLFTKCKTASYWAMEKKCYLSNVSCEPTVYVPGYSLITVPERKFRYISTAKKTWADAKLYCQSLGGQLARIYTPCENDRAKKLTPQISSVWIDGTDSENEGTWMFSDGSPLPGQDKSEFWGPDQPDNYWGAQDCIRFYYFSAYNLFKWDDEDCNYKYEFICEM